MTKFIYLTTVANGNSIKKLVNVDAIAYISDNSISERTLKSTIYFQGSEKGLSVTETLTDIKNIIEEKHYKVN